MADPAVVPYTVILVETGEPVGMSTLLDLRWKERVLEIGFTWYAAKVRGTKVNPETKLLLMSYAFEVLKVNRVAFKADARNARSLAGIRKLGAKEEGTLRQYMFGGDGNLRDTTYFSVLPAEWPAIKAKLQARL